MQFSRSAAETIRRETAAAQARGASGEVEAAGLLYGWRGRDDTEVGAVLPLPLGDMRAPEGMDLLGWFRSGLGRPAAPDGEDLEFHRRLFTEERAFLLIVQPERGAGIAGTVFIPGGDAPGLAVERVPVSGPSVPPAEPPRGWAAMAWLGAGLVAVMVVATALSGRGAERAASPQPGLRVELQANRLLASWNGSAPWMEGVQSGWLLVEDGAYGDAIPLNTVALRRGAMALGRRFSETTLVKLRLNRQGETIEESALVIAPSPLAAPAAALDDAAPQPPAKPAAERRLRPSRRRGR
ncbi:MAG TPA: hypothetical protein DEH78_10430 [Solibacterales bacterium]|nr:hypothetical protein [Bryobacterales bacterium]